MCILDFIQTTIFDLGRFLKNLADDQWSSVTKGSVYHIITYITNFTMGINYFIDLKFDIYWKYQLRLIFAHNCSFMAVINSVNPPQSSLLKNLRILLWIQSWVHFFKKHINDPLKVILASDLTTLLIVPSFLFVHRFCIKLFFLLRLPMDPVITLSLSHTNQDGPHTERKKRFRDVIIELWYDEMRFRHT